MGLLTGALYRICEWITRLAYLNLLWLLFSMIGFVVVGIMPATVAMFSVTRKWVMGQQDIPVFKTFWNTYKSDFVKSNVLGLALGFMAVMFYFDFRILQYMPAYQSVLQVVFLSLFFIYLLLLFFIFPVYVHYDIRLSQTFKFGVVIAFSRPLHSLGMIVASMILGTLLWLFPLLSLFFSGSVFSLLVMWFAIRAFRSLNRQHEKEAETRGIERVGLL
ncbi:YesL family protein [Ammoniphilus sp. 3BR4]|uniref:YesL family protein n=1 Tax=Ammoniphilus sp. 3BR4 TaxID=3158265 RepID=UPI0034667340